MIIGTDKVQFEEDYFYEEIVNVDECLDVVPPKLIKHIFELICDKTVNHLHSYDCFLLYDFFDIFKVLATITKILLLIL